MSTAILTQDFLGICLLVAEGDTRASIEDVCCAVENYQQTHHRHFGVSVDDFPEDAFLDVGTIGE